MPEDGPPVHHTPWALIRANRAMQNEPDPWAELCVCGHEVRHHRLDLDDPMDGLAPDCGFVVTVIDPDTLRKQTAPCPCMEFKKNVKGT